MQPEEESSEKIASVPEDQTKDDSDDKNPAPVEGGKKRNLRKERKKKIDFYDEESDSDY